MGAIDQAAALASQLGAIVSPSRFVFDWAKFPKGINDPSYILNGIGPAFDRASRVYQTLDLPPQDPSKVASAWQVFLDEATRVNKEFPSWKASMLASVPLIGPTVLLPAALAYRVSNNAFGAMVTALFYTASSGAFGHIAFKDKSTQEFSIHKMVFDGTISADTAMQHAGWCYTSFQLIVLLDEFRALTSLKKPGLSGALGLAPVAIIAIAAVATVLILAGAVVLSKNLSDINTLRARVVEDKLALMKEACAKTSDPKIIAQCASGPTKDDLVGGSLADGINNAIGKASADLVKYLAIGAAVLIGIQFLPLIVGRVKAGAKEAAA